MAGSDRHRAAAAGDHLEHGLDPVIEARRHGPRAQATVGVEREHVECPTASRQVEDRGRGDKLAVGQVDHRGVGVHALAHRRAGTDDVQRRRLEARQQLVEVVVAGGDAGDRVAAGEVLLDAVDGELHQLADVAIAVDDPAVGDAEHPALGVVEGIVDVVGAAVADLGDVGGDEDEAAQHRRVLDDLGVGRGVGDRRRGVLQGVQRLDAAGLFEQPEPRQLLGDGDRVDRTAGLRHGHGDVEDVLVGGLVEVVVAQPGLDHGAEGVARQQDGAEHRLLGLQVVRRDPPAGRRTRRPAAVPRRVRTVSAIHRLTLPAMPCGEREEEPGNSEENPENSVDSPGG